jgi:Ca2+-binding RTX toxin-like protein
VTIAAGTVVVNSGAGNDTVITGAGAETINGGGGVDTVDFSGTRAQYAINAAGGGVVTVTKGGITDTLTGISFLQFSDQTIAPPSPMTPAGTTADLILQETSGANTGQLWSTTLAAIRSWRAMR